MSHLKTIPKIHPVPNDISPGLRQCLLSIKDTIEVLLGRKQDLKQLVSLRGKTEVIDIKDNYLMSVNDFGKTIRNVTEYDLSVFLPTVTSTHDGFSIKFINTGTGKLTIVATQPYTINSTSTRTIYTDTDNTGTLILEYCHPVQMYFLISSNGTWTTA